MSHHRPPRSGGNRIVSDQIINGSYLRSVFGLFAVAPALLLPHTALAQLPLAVDTTLGGESSQVIPLGGNAFEIDGGAGRGSNLFHSFQDFNVNEGGSVYFRNPVGVENIFSRVTGNNPSNILGTLGVRGNANLFLLNPHGILFGPNAALDLRGSFLATTADAFQFGGQGIYSASNPESPSTLLTISPSAFFFNQLLPGRITTNATNLTLANGENLRLLGGEVILRGGELNAFGGRIEIAAIAAPGAIQFNSDGSLSIPDELARGNITLEDATLDVALDNGGAVGIFANTLTIVNSRINAGIRQDLGNPASQAGDVILDATDSILLRNSRIFNRVREGATGNGGNLNVFTRVLEVLEGAQLQTLMDGVGAAGNIRIEASDRATFSGTTTDGEFLPSAAASILLNEAVGSSGGIDIITGVLEVLDGAWIIASTAGDGNAGRIRIAASDRVTLAGLGGDGQSSLISSDVLSEATGNGGTIEIITGILEVLNGGEISTDTLGTGNGGNIQIAARDRVTLSGTQEFQNSRVSSDSGFGALGDGGMIEIDTGLLEVLNGAALSTSTFGTGNGGDIRIQSRERVTIARTGTITFPPDRGGGFAFDTASEISSQSAGLAGFDDELLAELEQFPELFFDVGQSGRIEITTPILEVLDGGEISTTSSISNAGDIVIRARDRVTVSGIIPDSTSDFSQFNSSISSQNIGLGDGGRIEITTRILDVLDGGELTVNSGGSGDAGDIVINASDRVTFAGTGGPGTLFFLYPSLASAVTDGGGDGGQIIINTQILDVRDGARLVATTFGEGNAGDIRITASDRVTVSGFFSALRSTVGNEAIGNGGRILISTRSLDVGDGGSLTVATVGTGNAGSIRIEASDRVALSGFSSVSSTVDDEARGNGGNIAIATNSFGLIDSTVAVQSASLTGGAGSIFITAREVSLDNSILNAETLSTPRGFEGATITLRGLDTLLMQNGSLISARALANANGGNIAIDARDGFVLGSFTGNNDIIATAEQGDGGNITIQANRIFGFIDQTDAGLTFTELRANSTSDISASSEFGAQGNVALEVLAVDPTQGLTELPGNLVDVSDQIGQVCPTGAGASARLGSFIITGRGGIAPDPTALLDRDAVEAEWVEPGEWGEDEGDRGEQSDEEVSAVMEAQSWVVGADGQVHLVAGQQNVSAGLATELPNCP